MTARWGRGLRAPPPPAFDARVSLPVRSRAMPRDPRHDILFEPVEIGPKTLRNRFYQVPHCTGFGIGKPSSQAHHRAMKAEGGWAAVCTEYAAVSPDSDEAPYAGAVWDDGDCAPHRLMAEQAHAPARWPASSCSTAACTAHNADSRLPPSRRRRSRATTTASSRGR